MKKRNPFEIPLFLFGAFAGMDGGVSSTFFFPREVAQKAKDCNNSNFVERSGRGPTQLAGADFAAGEITTEQRTPFPTQS